MELFPQALKQWLYVHDEKHIYCDLSVEDLEEQSISVYSGCIPSFKHTPAKASPNFYGNPRFDSISYQHLDNTNCLGQLRLVFEVQLQTTHKLAFIQEYREDAVDDEIIRKLGTHIKLRECFNIVPVDQVLEMIAVRKDFALPDAFFVWRLEED